MPGRVSHVTANWFRCRPRTGRGPWHWHPSRFPSGDRTSRVCPHPSPIAGPWHWLRDGSLVNMVIPGSYARYPYWWRRRWWWCRWSGYRYPLSRVPPFSYPCLATGCCRLFRRPVGRPFARDFAIRVNFFILFTRDSWWRRTKGRHRDTCIKCLIWD